MFGQERVNSPDPVFWTIALVLAAVVLLAKYRRNIVDMVTWIRNRKPRSGLRPKKR